MDQTKNFYLTTTLPYVNSSPHIGFALEIIQADAICRYMSKQGYSVIFNTGTDEHGLKIYQKALEEGKDPQVYTDEYAKHFKDLKEKLNLSFNRFIRTTDKNHKEAAKHFWNLSLKNGDIYKDKYAVKYCVGCELEKQDSELENGKCPIHPNMNIELVEEENYYFKFSKYQEPLLKIYNENPSFVVPAFRLEEIKKFVSEGLKDFSISRLKEKMPWGVEVPGDSDHVMYVWFDALINYISTLGWPNKDSDFKGFWPGVQVAGKDNLRQQSAMWQAMLLSAGLKPSKQILIHGFINSDGQKMSKSLGNVIDPLKIVDNYGIDALRYYLLSDAPTFGEDMDYADDKFKNRVNGDLANGIGNLVARVTKMCETSGFEYILNFKKAEIEGVIDKTAQLMSEYKIDEVCAVLTYEVSVLDKHLQETKPWENIAENKELLELVLNKILFLLDNFEFILPTTKQRVFDHLGVSEDIETVKKVTHLTGLFPRIQ